MTKNELKILSILVDDLMESCTMDEKKRYEGDIRGVKTLIFERLSWIERMKKPEVLDFVDTDENEGLSNRCNG